MISIQFYSNETWVAKCLCRDFEISFKATHTTNYHVSFQLWIRIYLIKRSFSKSLTIALYLCMYVYICACSKSTWLSYSIVKTLFTIHTTQTSLINIIYSKEIFYTPTRCTFFFFFLLFPLYPTLNAKKKTNQLFFFLELQIVDERYWISSSLSFLISSYYSYYYHSSHHQSVGMSRFQFSWYISVTLFKYTTNQFLIPWIHAVDTYRYISQAIWNHLNAYKLSAKLSVANFGSFCTYPDYTYTHTRLLH